MLHDLIAENPITPGDKDVKESLEKQDDADENNFEDQLFINSLFKVEFYERKPNVLECEMMLKLSPPLDQYGHAIMNGFVECPILFKCTIRGKWARYLWVEKEDVVRIIGTFSKLNSFHLMIDDDNEERDEQKLLHKASMIIVEPHILIPTTTIVKAFPCVRKAYLGQ
jgi:hypothetical protein